LQVFSISNIVAANHVGEMMHRATCIHNGTGLSVAVESWHDFALRHNHCYIISAPPGATCLAYKVLSIPIPWPLFIILF